MSGGRAKTADYGAALAGIDVLAGELELRFGDVLVVNQDLDRSLVSFQANKAENGCRWYKYREGFAAQLVRYVLREVEFPEGPMLDPFAGSGTALFVASEAGRDSIGIELLANSAEITQVRHLLRTCNVGEMAGRLADFASARAWEQPGAKISLNELRITRGAYPADTTRRLERYLYLAARHPEPEVARVLRFAALCVLEDVSYTRKDGQYLRWDARSGHSTRSTFRKPHIEPFTDAVCAKIAQIVTDLEARGRERAAGRPGAIELRVGSCLDVLPQLEEDSCAGLITSPPYCNRYDYTRTYALELALLGVTEGELKDLRQAMLSCTVENRAKGWLRERARSGAAGEAMTAFENQRCLQAILRYLEGRRDSGAINNRGIPRMVRNYFLELAFVIGECRRVLRTGAPFVMVNDNVRYCGAVVPVDLILSDIAGQLGFDVEVIWVLPRGKGNSSQQMGRHGRKEIRKCVYVWRLRD